MVAHPVSDWRSSARPITMSVGAAPPIVGSSPLRAATPRARASASCSRCARVRLSRIDGEPRGLVVGLFARLRGLGRVDETDRGWRGVGRVGDALQLCGHVGEQIAAERHDPVAGAAEGDTATVRDVPVVRFGTVLIERGRPHLGVHPQHIGARGRLGIRPLPARMRGDHLIREEHLITGHPPIHLQQRPRDRKHPVHTDMPLQQRRPKRGSRAGRSSPVSMSHVGATARCARSSRDLWGPRRAQGEPLNELIQVVAAQPGGQPLVGAPATATARRVRRRRRSGRPRRGVRGLRRGRSDVSGGRTAWCARSEESRSLRGPARAGGRARESDRRLRLRP